MDFKMNINHEFISVKLKRLYNIIYSQFYSYIYIYIYCLIIKFFLFQKSQLTLHEYFFQCLEEVTSIAIRYTFVTG